MKISDNPVQFHSIFDFKVYICALCSMFSSCLHFFSCSLSTCRVGLYKINTVILPQGLDMKNISFQKQIKKISMKNNVGIV